MSEGVHSAHKCAYGAAITCTRHTSACARHADNSSCDSMWPHVRPGWCGVVGSASRPRAATHLYWSVGPGQHHRLAGAGYRHGQGQGGVARCCKHMMHQWATCQAQAQAQWPSGVAHLSSVSNNMPGPAGSLQTGTGCDGMTPTTRWPATTHQHFVRPMLRPRSQDLPHHMRQRPVEGVHLNVTRRIMHIHPGTHAPRTCVSATACSHCDLQGCRPSIRVSSMTCQYVYMDTSACVVMMLRP